MKKTQTKTDKSLKSVAGLSSSFDTCTLRYLWDKNGESVCSIYNKNGIPYGWMATAPKDTYEPFKNQVPTVRAVKEAISIYPK